MIRRISGSSGRSLDRPAYKEKLRLRTYRTPHADTEAFVEIKKKYDHVVYKRRIGMNYQQAVDYLDGAPAPEKTQISDEIDWFCRFYEGIRPAMCIFYDRLAVFDREQPDLRVTFDSGIRWRTDDLDLAHGTRGRLLLDPSGAPHGDQDPRRGAGLARPCALGRRCVPEPLFQIRRGLSDHAARRKNHPI